MLSKRTSDWPKRDHELWILAWSSTTSDPFAAGHVAWRERTWRIVRLAYGRWLQWLDQRGQLDPGRSPAARINRDRLAAFVADERARVSDQMVYRTVHCLLQATRLMDPGTDLDWTRSLLRTLRRRARAGHVQRNPPCLSEPLYQLGLQLIHSATDEADDLCSLERFRDGVIIGLLALVPVRVGQFAQLECGFLGESAGGISIRWPADTTKTGRTDRWTLPPDFAAYVRRYVEVVRVRLLARRRGTAVGPMPHFWIGRSGRPIGDQVIRQIIKQRAAEGLGHKVLPHDFRRSAATSYVLAYPERALEANAVLGHSDFATTERHYIAGRQIQARRTYHDLLRSRQASQRRRQPRSASPGN